MVKDKRNPTSVSFNFKSPSTQMRFFFLKNTAQIITDELLNHPSKLRVFFYIKFIVLQNIT